MFGYYLDLALRSLRRSPILTALMVLAIGLGIGASMTMLTVLHVWTAIRCRGAARRCIDPAESVAAGSYKQGKLGDAPSLMMTLAGRNGAAGGTHGRAAGGDGRGYHAGAIRSGDGAPQISGTGVSPLQAFFAMFGVPFLQGKAWSTAEDAKRARVVVVTT